ncbi:rhodanese-like domain-containing protein [Enterococcus sp. 5H]|uniref:rhodanese-like domain-containing protein n=1 Tax=Enterococcus sp. 5H TaxID=1229490 RepID=UPI002304B71B|nr:rhodanese-like domain-containing protein [Enterococcus sp. 5H]MDA9472791.1 Rhodanese-related sulfurtransferase [Enterococcus sp. 5H]
MFSFFKGNSISTKELELKLGEKPEILDVREKTEFATGHIPSAKNLPLSKISSYKVKENKSVYVICQSGMRSRQAVKQLKNRGIDAVNVRGGMSAWRGETRGGKL